LVDGSSRRINTFDVSDGQHVLLRSCLSRVSLREGMLDFARFALILPLARFAARRHVGFCAFCFDLASRAFRCAKPRCRQFAFCWRKAANGLSAVRVLLRKAANGLSAVHVCFASRERAKYF
jgi:hypothetical protein